MSYHDWTLDNGLRVVSEQHPHMKSVSIGFFVKTGSRDEPPEVNGVSHFLEHMLFKGSHTRTGAEIDETLDALGAEYNAFTGHEYTGYYARILPEHLEQTTELLSDMMRPALRAEDFEVEKNVILEEIALYEDRPASVVRRHALGAYYDGQPLGQDILGSPESVRALTVEQMRAYYEHRYAPNNMVLAVTGAFVPERTQTLVERHCGAWEPAETTRAYPPFTPAPRQLKLERPHVSRQHAVLISPAPAYQDPRREAMDLLVDVLGHPGNSRLYWALVDKGLVDYAVASYQAQDGNGLVGINLSCDPEHMDAALLIVQEEITRLVAEGVTQDELDGARNRVLTALAVEGEQSLRRLFSFSFDFLYDEPYQSLDDILNAYREVSVADANALLRAYPFEPQTLASLGPGRGDG